MKLLTLLASLMIMGKIVSGQGQHQSYELKTDTLRIYQFEGDINTINHVLKDSISFSTYCVIYYDSLHIAHQGNLVKSKPQGLWKSFDEQGKVKSDHLF